MTYEMADKIIDKYTGIATDCSNNYIEGFGMFKKDMNELTEALKFAEIIKRDIPDNVHITTLFGIHIFLQTIEETGVEYYTRYKIKEI